MKLLAVETASEACSVALHLDGETLEDYRLSERQHTRIVLPMVEQILQRAGLALAQLDGLAFGRGPGSFTGVRVATGVIQGIALGADLPVVPVSTLAAMAQEHFNKAPQTNVVFSALDARLGEIYWGVYERGNGGLAQLVGKESVGPAAAVEHYEQLGFGVGSAWKIYAAELQNCLQQSCLGFDAIYLPRAAMIAELGVAGFVNNEAVSAEQALPVYLRDKVALKESERS